jgi:RNA polymerase sigma factor (sigma-70 family)
MLEQDQVARWVVGLKQEDLPDERTAKFLECSSAVWRFVLAHGRREATREGLTTDEGISLALEVWEETLRSVWKTWQQRPTWAWRIRNPEKYLIGAFRHRWNRHLKRKRLHDSILEFREPQELAEMQCEANMDEDSALRIYRGMQLEQAYQWMNPKIRHAIIASAYGFSWAEIAKKLGIDEQNLIMRVQYALRKVRDRLAQRRVP